MQRFFSIAILLNWCAILTYIGTVGFGFHGEANGLISAAARMLETHGSGQASAGIAQGIVVILAMVVTTSAMWALMAVLFSNADGSETRDEDFVIAAALAIILSVFAIIACASIWLSDPEVGALIAIASFATLLTGVAHRICRIEAQMHKSSVASINSRGFDAVSAARATSMANQSAVLATMGARTSRFVPKTPFQP